MIHKRRKGVAIVETKKGILVGAIEKTFILPGGGAERWETRKKAAIRELYEETGLRTISIKFLFEDKGIKWKNHKGLWVKNYSKVFLIKAKGTPRPRNEIKKISFWKPKSKLNLGRGSKTIIERYLKEFK